MHSTEVDKAIIDTFTTLTKMISSMETKLDKLQNQVDGFMNDLMGPHSENVNLIDPWDIYDLKLSLADPLMDRKLREKYGHVQCLLAGVVLEDDNVDKEDITFNSHVLDNVIDIRLLLTGKHIALILITLEKDFQKLEPITHTIKQTFQKAGLEIRRIDFGYAPRHYAKMIEERNNPVKGCCVFNESATLDMRSTMWDFMVDTRFIKLYVVKEKVVCKECKQLFYYAEPYSSDSDTDNEDEEDNEEGQSDDVEEENSNFIEFEGDDAWVTDEDEDEEEYESGNA
jgi:hypothetical protein